MEIKTDLHFVLVQNSVLIIYGVPTVTFIILIVAFQF